MKLRRILLGTTALLLATPAFADDAAILQRLDAMQQTIDKQQKEIESQKTEIGDLKHSLARRGVKMEPQTTAAAAPALDAKVADQGARIDEIVARMDVAQSTARIEKQDSPQWTLAGGRPQIQSPDGRFSLALRLLGQFDAAYYMQSAGAKRLAAANGPDLSSGTNFRRAQIGFQGKLFGDWSYFFNTEYGGSGGTESQGRVQALYVQYDGLAPFAFRIGAYPPSGGLEDNTSSADTIFLERAAASDIMRNTVGGDGRDSASISYAGDQFYAALSLTGGKVADAAVFDEQEAVLGRVADSLYSDSDSRIVVSASGAHVFQFADTTAGPGAMRNVTLAASPELTVDSTGTKLVSTSAINAAGTTIWGVETGGNWQNLYGQAGYFSYSIDRRHSALPSPNFDGWYAQATWVLTGEARGYSTANAAFTAPKPRIPFSLPGSGWGAWELAARYSDLNLDDNAGHAGAATPLGGIRGGEQKIWTLGLNWYPNAVIRFALDWQHIDVDRLGTIPAGFGHPVANNTQVGQTINVLALRSQLSL